MKQPFRQQLDIEDVGAVAGFFLGEEVKQQRRQSRIAQGIGDAVVARTQATAATPVNEHDNAPRLFRSSQQALETERRDPHMLRRPFALALLLC
jgi:hypothetical protein